MRDEQETLKIINNFALRLISLPTKTDLAWFVAREVVGQLGFDDCVVYMYDAQKNVLRQTAAIGDEKNPAADEIRNALEIKIGTGITGHVGLTRKSIIVDDLADDDRYIPDINAARSEICVPLVAGGQLFGVIDSESPEPGHFTPADLETLTTVAAMASAKLKLLEQDKTLEMQEKLLSAENEIIQALHAAEAANRAKSEFLSTMSHELRTPLTSIKGALGLISSKMQDTGGIDQAELLDMALRNCDALVDLVTDFLDYEKIIAGKMEFKAVPTDIEELARQTVETNQGLARTYSVDFRFHKSKGPMWARIDTLRYAQILRNLLSNAAKFSPEGNKVDISVTSTGSHIRTSVEDFGIGIAEADRADVFERFTQIDASDTRQQGGTGLGLAISRSLAESMGGGLNFRSSVGKGSVFYFDLPATESPMPQGS